MPREVAVAHSIVLTGVTGHLVDVQVHVTQGLVSTHLVGRPDASVMESRDRCRTAIATSGLQWPTTRRVTILLSPADLPKRGTHLDLAIAMVVLAATEQVESAAFAELVMLGELSLDGRLRAVPAVLPMVMAARAHGFSAVMLPDAHAAEARRVPGMEVLGVRSLAQAVAVLNRDPVPPAAPVAPPAARSVLTWRGEHRTEELDLADVHGMADARWALEVAAAGGHHLLLSGPKGAGKTTLAERLPGLLPDLGLEESLELSAVLSLCGQSAEPSAAARPPFRAPHHSATKASVLGGGTGTVHPGELSRALHGVLFLDEFPLFNQDIIDALRQPLEHGEVTIARGEEVATFPARTTVVLAANPCPCGDFHPDARESRCTCSEVKRRSYRERVAGPVSDRIDITRHLSPVRPAERFDVLDPPEPTAVVRARVEAARGRQARRYAGTAWRLNADVPGPELARRWPLTPDAQAVVDEAVRRGRLTRRGAVRVHRLAWTVADLRRVAASDPSAVASVEEPPGVAATEAALRLRTGEPLLLTDLPGSGAGGIQPALVVVGREADR